jgi:NAD(P)H-dependent FMN reductase
MKIFIINGSASVNSSNERLIANVVSLFGENFSITVFNELKSLPHFDPELSIENTPPEILDLRQGIKDADAVIICTPEYVFSIPSGLKNALEWCVSTTVFTDKPLGLSAKFLPETTLLVSGIRGKVSSEGNISDDKLKADLKVFVSSLKEMLLS